MSSQLEIVTVSGEIYGRKRVRRNDSSSGRPPAGELDIRTPTGCDVSEGVIAEPHIGCDVKILAKAQQKQIDRVINDLRGFGSRMRSLYARCINVAVVGVNHESEYVSYEGERQYCGRLRPLEAKQTEERVREIHDDFDEVLILPFRATNEAPTYPLAWIDEAKTRRDYGAILTRIGSLYDERFS